MTQCIIYIYYVCSSPFSSDDRVTTSSTRRVIFLSSILAGDQYLSLFSSRIIITQSSYICYIYSLVFTFIMREKSNIYIYKLFDDEKEKKARAKLPKLLSGNKLQRRERRIIRERERAQRGIRA